jgi:4-hydroxy-2-oxoheptanedioate aldolase
MVLKGRDMREKGVKRLWQQDRPALGGWLVIPGAFSAEVMAHQGLDWLCIDMQHGLIDSERLGQLGRDSQRRDR